jgi:hypothetical protein
MAKTSLAIIEGPLKPDMQWAVAYPEKDLHVHFETESDPVDVHLDRIEEIGDGTTFGLTGHVVSSNFRGRPFRAVYHLSEHDPSGTKGIIEIPD